LAAAVASFNCATTPADLQLDAPFDLWRKKKRAGNVRIGDVVEVVDQAGRSRWRCMGSRRTARYAVVLNATEDQYQLGVSGELEPRWIDSRFVRACRGAGVFLPGPLKLRARAEHKVQTDYATEPAPAAASLVDLVRATVVFEEPYSMACFVKYMQKTMRVVRMKNRFENDAAEKISAAQLQQQFYAAESWGYDDGSSEASGETYYRTTYDKMYRDVLLNVEVPREGGEPFIAEVQVALSGIAILKKSEQKVYSIMRMKHAAELCDTFVFDHKDLDGPSSPTSQKSTHFFHDPDAPESRVETDLADVAVEVEEVPLFKEQEILPSEAPAASGFMQGMFSCACEPCEEVPGCPVVVSAQSSAQVAVPKSSAASFGGVVAEQHAG
jgi:hypothetical protein